MIRHCIFVILLLFLFVATKAQSPYELRSKTDGLLIGSSLLLAGIDLGLRQHIQPFGEADIAALDAAKLPGIDRFTTENWSPRADHRSDIGFYTSIGAALSLPVIMPLLSKEEKSFSHFMRLSVIWAEANVLTAALTEITKQVSQRPRPYVYNSEAPFNEKVKVDAQKSFFSGHASVAAVNGIFLAKVFSDYYPESKWKPLVWVLGAGLPAWAAVERVNAGKHFPTDVLTGYAVGAFFGYFVPHWHKKKTGEERHISFTPYSSANGSGMLLRLRF